MSARQARSLAEIQSLFWSLIRAPEGAAAGARALEKEGRVASADLYELVLGDGRLSAVERVDVYADMYFYRLRDCLREDYPKLAECLGAARFHNLVTDYLLAHPSRHFSLRELGRALPAFLARHALARERPVLADLARLEWARVDVFDAADAVRVGPSDLVSVDSRIALSPALRLLPLDPAALQLWHGSPADPDRSGRSCVACVWRRGFSVHHRSLESEEAACLTALAERAHTLAELAECLARHAEHGAPRQAVQPAGRPGHEDLSVRFAAHLSRWLADELIVAPTG